VTQAHYERSKLLYATRENEYKAIATQVCDAVIALGNALLAHKAFTTDLGSADWFHLRPVDAVSIERAMGDPREAQSLSRRILNSAAESGKFNLQTLPADWTPLPTAAPAVSPPVQAKASNKAGTLARDGAGRMRRFYDSAAP
jgi:hypothetical protein